MRAWSLYKPFLPKRTTMPGRNPFLPWVFDVFQRIQVVQDAVANVTFLRIPILQVDWEFIDFAAGQKRKRFRAFGPDDSHFPADILRRKVAVKVVLFTAVTIVEQDAVKEAGPTAFVPVGVK